MALVTETQLVTIDNQLRLILFGLECALDAEFSVDVVEKIFSDCEEDAVNEKALCTLGSEESKSHRVCAGL